MAVELLLETTKLTFLNISNEGSMVVQCKATNKHGRISANAYLRVLGKSLLLLLLLLLLPFMTAGYHPSANTSSHKQI